MFPREASERGDEHNAESRPHVHVRQQPTTSRKSDPSVHVPRIAACTRLAITMSGRLASARLATLARRTALHTPRFFTTHSLPAGGLLRNEAALRLVKRRPWPLGSYALHNLPATRSISFARIVPKLVTKLATAGAAAGGAVIAGVSYIQYQAGRMCTLSVLHTERQS